MNLQKKNKSKKLSTLTAVKNRIWKKVSKYVRLKDADHRGMVQCYTCGVVKHYTEMDAGHGIAGRKNAVLFDLDILKPQCKMCNGFKGGMQYDFGKRLNEENGEEWFEKKQENAFRVVKITRGEYEEIEQDINEKLRGLNNE